MTLNDQEQAVLGNLELLFRMGKSEPEAVEQLLRMGVDGSLVERVIAVRTEVAKGLREVAFNDGALYDPEEAGPAWYTGPAEFDVFWPKLRVTLEADPNWVSAVPSLDMTSSDIVGFLAEPHSPKIATRGLVVGHVQSGKTANFTATIAKAADAGYRMFIILSGVHNALRRQTQLRLERQLYDLQPKRWLALTDEHRDFGNPVRALSIMASTDLRLLAVVKKNVSRLTRLRDWLRQANDHGGLDTCPVLIIDDEADQASPNASRNPELDRTRINERIVELLSLPRVAYIGYTATPFANVLVDPRAPADLYPRHFIYALNKPDTYFGAEELFGLGMTGEEDQPAHDMIRIVPDDEADLHRVRSGQPFVAQITPAMRSAILWFVVATSARRVRTGQTPHSSMLIHTTERVQPHLQYLPLIRDLLRNLKTQLERNDEKTVTELRSLWAGEQTREPPTAHGLDALAFSDIRSSIPGVLEDVKVVADNGISVERLLYDDTAGTTVIAVGGNTLSRGLTLEGLIASFFLRGANAYDTLLQMGRWFGYRPGYGDLPRIWTTKELARNFRFLADVERDLRIEIDRYRIDQTSPSEVPVRIMLHPSMAITNRVRMQFAVQTAASFSGQRPQTILFNHRDREGLKANLKAGQSMVRTAITAGATVDPPQSGKVIIRGVSTGNVIGFINAYRWHLGAQLDSKMLCEYIVQQNDKGQLVDWNVAIITVKEPMNGNIDLGLSYRVGLITRSKLRDMSPSDTANIGTLMSKPDRVADLMEPHIAVSRSEAQLVQDRTDSGRALLVLYPIYSGSVPRITASNRENLEAVENLLGVAIAFPKAHGMTSSRVAVDLTRIGRPQVDRDEGEADDEYVDEEGDHNELDLSDTAR